MKAPISVSISFFLLLALTAETYAQNAQQLEPGKAVEHQISKGQVHSYRIALTSGEYLHVAAEQNCIYIEVALYGPDGKKITAFANSKGLRDSVPVSAVATVSGQYTLSVRSLDEGASGRYRVSIEELRAATEQDGLRVEAERALLEGERLDAPGTEEAHKAALKKFEEALALWRAAGDRREEARTLVQVGRMLNSLDQKDRAIDCFNQALEIQKAINDRRGQAQTLFQIASFNDNRGKKKEALSFYGQALAIQQAEGDRRAMSHTLCKAGLVEFQMGSLKEGFEKCERALALSRETCNRRAEGETLNNLGGIFFLQGDYSKALEYFNQALTIRREFAGPRDAAQTLNNITGVSFMLGKYEEALKGFIDLLELRRSLGDSKGVAAVLNNIGGTYFNKEDYPRAIRYYKQALLEFRKNQDKTNESRALANIGNAYTKLSRKQKKRENLAQALDFLNRSLPLAREVGAPQGIAETLWGLGLLYKDTGDLHKALTYFNQTLVISRSIKAAGSEGETLKALMEVWKQLNAPRIAIFYGKQAVNAFQQMRASIQGLGAKSQKSFLKSKETAYRELADLLISQGRLPEAEEVLKLLKQEEYSQFVKRDDKDQASRGIELSLEENRYWESAQGVASIGAEWFALFNKKDRTPAEEARLEELDAVIVKANREFHERVGQFSRDSKDAAKSLKESRGLQSDLGEMGPGTAALLTLTGEEKYVVILITPGVSIAREYPIKASDLNRKVELFREALENPRRNPLPIAQELYKILVGPVARDLEDARASTLMWSLDGVLRYLPVAALHDGRRYLIESYRIESFTLASRARLKDQVGANWRGLGLGCSKPYEGFAALPGVPSELHGIINEQGATQTTGVLPGMIKIDEDFTEQAMNTALRKRFQLVHIASHFRFSPGNENDSFLLLGDGRHLTLRQIRDLPSVFDGVELLTLSACSTAVGGTDADGKELEGFAMLAEILGAKAVLGSLWSVADESTVKLMQEFYRLREEKPGTTKAEALRQAQRAFLHGNKITESDTTTRGPRIGKADQNEFRANPNAPYAHPYFWAPFVLIGNWR